VPPLPSTEVPGPDPPPPLGGDGARLGAPTGGPTSMRHSLLMISVRRSSSTSRKLPSSGPAQEKGAREPPPTPPPPPAMVLRQAGEGTRERGGETKQGRAGKGNGVAATTINQCEWWTLSRAVRPRATSHATADGD
jgi:hypothetical protein